MRDLTVTLIQDDISWQDPQANQQRNQKHVEAVAGKTDLIVLPEMFSTGYYEQPWETFETMQGETVAWMRESAGKYNAVITGSLIMKTGDQFVN